MAKFFYSFAPVALLSLTLVEGYSAQNNPPQAISTAPVGYVAIDITPGTGVAKRNSLVSIPLLGRDSTIPSRGVVLGVKDSRTLRVAPLDKGEGGQASWTRGRLSSSSEPFLLKMTSGGAEGRMFLVSTVVPNTEEEVTLRDPYVAGFNLATEGVGEGDQFVLLPCDTLLSFFGTPEAGGVFGGPSAKEADTIVLIEGGAASTYYFSTTLGRWTRVGLGSPDASHTPLHPYYGLQYSRLSSSPLKLVAVGDVPTGKRKLTLRNSGSTILSTYWPTHVPLGNSGVHLTQGWAVAGGGRSGDQVTFTKAGSASSHVHDGTNWRKVGPGSPLSDEDTMNPGGAALLTRRQFNSQSNPILTQVAPYSF
jgi:hypothetical protein